MPKLVCHTCGRLVYATVPLSDLFPEERRCPRCGAYLETDRREGSRRHYNRRESESGDPTGPDGVERRGADRRVERRRKSDRGSQSG